MNGGAQDVKLYPLQKKRPARFVTHTQKKNARMINGNAHCGIASGKRTVNIAK